uniref:Uncharacterized protein n=1 Tax=Rhizophora mucronata TaxID=61149 RepID=A0A2P2J4F6_RHIMU
MLASLSRKEVSPVFVSQEIQLFYACTLLTVCYWWILNM